jgi:ADP-ribosylglycohydrolase
VADPRPDLRDRFLGCLVGCAVGDALGAPFEGYWGWKLAASPTTNTVAEPTIANHGSIVDAKGSRMNGPFGRESLLCL